MSIGRDIYINHLELNSHILNSVNDVTDLGVTYDCRLSFLQHIVNIVTKAHSRANLIVRCFVPKNVSSLLPTFTVFVRPILEYCSVVWNPHLIKDINAIEKVQRRFTKRLAGMNGLPYEQRLTKLGIDSLEVRRMRADLIFMYKIVFGLCEGVTRDNLFKMCSVHNYSRGHRYRVYLPVVKSSARYNFFSYRVLNSWNSLPNTTDFSSLAKFKTGLSTRMLLRYCKVCLA